VLLNFALGTGVMTESFLFRFTRKRYKKCILEITITFLMADVNSVKSAQTGI